MARRGGTRDGAAQRGARAPRHARGEERRHLRRGDEQRGHRRGRGTRSAGAAVPAPANAAARLLPAHPSGPAPRPRHQRHRPGEDGRDRGARVVPPQREPDPGLRRHPVRAIVAAHPARAGPGPAAGAHHPPGDRAGTPALAGAGGGPRRAHESRERDGVVGEAGARLRGRGVRDRAVPAAGGPVPQARAAGAGGVHADEPAQRGVRRHRHRAPLLGRRPPRARRLGGGGVTPGGVHRIPHRGTPADVAGEGGGTVPHDHGGRRGRRGPRLRGARRTGRRGRSP